MCMCLCVSSRRSQRWWFTHSLEFSYPSLWLLCHLSPLLPDTYDVVRCCCFCGATREPSAAATRCLESFIFIIFVLVAHYSAAAFFTAAMGWAFSLPPFSVSPSAVSGLLLL